MIPQKAALAASLFLLSACATPSADPTNAADDITTYMSTLSVRGFTGAVFVQQGDSVLLSSGYGNSAGGTRRTITDSSRFYLASVSKQFTGLAVRVAIDSGYIDSDSRLIDYFPALGTSKGDITVEQLLAHSSGLPEYSSAWREAYQRDEALHRVITSDLEFSPGSKYGYSNTGYTVLALLIGEATGSSFGDFMRTHVFDPAGMADTHLLGEDIPQTLTGVRSLVDGEPLWAPEDWSGPGWSHYGAGGIVSTLRDMKAWARFLEECSAHVGSACHEMLQPLIDTRAGRYASGMRVTETEYGGKLFYHFGSEASGHSAAFMWFPDTDVTVVVLSNRLEDDRDYAVRTAVSLARKVFEPEYHSLPFYADTAQ